MSGEVETICLVLTNVPDVDVAARLARTLVEGRIAACVSIGAPARSIYSWKGAVEETVELPLMIKTTRARYEAVENAIRAMHPYEVPEIIAVPVIAGLPAYAEWVRAETRAD